MATQTEAVAHSQLVGGAQTSLHSHAGGGASDIALTLRLPSIDETIPANYSAYVVGDYEIAGGTMLELAAGGVFEIG
jgi:hypothetical protein